MNKAPAFQFYPTDLLADENFVLMSLEARGAYITLICYCWLEGSIPADTNRMAKLCGIDGSAMAQLWVELSTCFSSVDGRCINTWLERQRLRQIEYKKDRQEAGKKGAESRWDKAKSLNAQPDNNDSSANGSAIAQLQQEPIANDGSSSSSSSSSSISSTKRATRKKRAPKPTTVDDAYLEELQRSPAYSHLNVKAQFARMVEWCKPRDRDPNRLTLIGWLNREPPPPVEAQKPAADEWANAEIAEKVEDLPPHYRRICQDATDQQIANVLAQYNRRVREARGLEVGH